MALGRNFAEVILHTSPPTAFLLLASIACCAAFIYRARKARESNVTDGVLFISSIAFIGFSLVISLGQAIHAARAQGIDSDRPLSDALENVTVNSCIGAILIATMTIVQLLKKR